MKKKLNIKISKMREYGFIDGYSGRKSQEDLWIKRFYKKRIKVNTIKDYIESYRTGYKIGQCTAYDLDNTKVQDGNIYYKNEVINGEISKESLNNKIKILKHNKK